MKHIKLVGKAKIYVYNVQNNIRARLTFVLLSRNYVPEHALMMEYRIRKVETKAAMKKRTRMLHDRIIHVQPGSNVLEA